MGKITGFMEFGRQVPSRRPVTERIKHYREFEGYLPEEELRKQGARCMDCGVPFCHNGCPLGNIIPDWNDLVYRGHWDAAIEALHSTNNFPEFTGRICPAPCEESCVLNINDDPVTIKLIEKTIIDEAWKRGLVAPQPAKVRTGRKVAIIGSGPAGLACAQQLARAGHDVTVFERDDRIGGLLRYGIPDFKMEKHHIDRRAAQMEAESVTFRTSVDVGKDVTADELRRDFDAIVMAVGATKPRDLAVEGRDLAGIRFAMEFLPQQNKRVAGDTIDPAVSLTAGCTATLETDESLTVVPYTLLPGGRVVVEVGINGQGPFRFAVDTAATGSFLTERARAQLALPHIPGVTTTVYGAIATGEFPLVEWITSTSRALTSASTCRAKISSKLKSLAAAVINEVSVVMAMAGSAWRFFM